MDILETIAHDIALEVKSGRWPNFNQHRQDPSDCFTILSELQSRAVGYELTEYVQALSSAIEKEGYR